ncbi:hypothetical protein LXL04_007810 [Taraxacum kok-saghyz]
MEAIESQSQSQEQDSHVMSEDAEGKILIEHESLQNLSIKLQISYPTNIYFLLNPYGLLEDVGKNTNRISDLEKEAVGLWEQILDLTDKNGLLEAEKAKVADLNLVIIKSMEQTTDLLNERFNLLKAKETKLQEQISLGLSEIAKRDAQITELNAHIDQLKVSHKAEEDTKRLKTQLRENHERKVLALNQKIQQLKDDNAILEAEKANRPELA